jgi:O-methyltransferase involved in polyketide biosynthesis
MYLEEEAVADTLRFIASLPPASGIVFDYAVLPALLSPRELRGFEALSARAAGHGEPWKTAFDPEGLTARLRSLGFSEVENFTAAQITARYLSGRADGLRKSGVSRLVCARV